MKTSRKQWEKSADDLSTIVLAVVTAYMSNAKFLNFYKIKHSQRLTRVNQNSYSKKCARQLK